MIGSVDPQTMTETDEGLYVEGQLDLEDSEVARQAWRSMKNGTISLSFGYMVTADRERPDGVRELLGIDLFEVTLTPSPANPETRIVSMKSASQDAFTAADWAGITSAFDQAQRQHDERKEIEQLAAKAKKRNRPIKVKTFEA